MPEKRRFSDLVAETHAANDAEFRARYPLAAALVRIRMAGLMPIEIPARELSALPADWRAEAELRRTLHRGRP